MGCIMDGFHTVFIFTDKAGLIWEGSGEMAVGIISFAVTSAWALYAFYALVFNRNLKRITNLMLAMILMFSATGFIWSGYKEMRRFGNEYSHIQELYNSQSYKIVEGMVHVIRVESQSGHDAGDVIRVGDVGFAISCYNIQFTYSQAIHCGGVLSDGVFARIYYYVDNYGYPQILRLDVKK
jgi:hypothetical protein